MKKRVLVFLLSVSMIFGTIVPVSAAEYDEAVDTVVYDQKSDEESENVSDEIIEDLRYRY